MNRTAMKLAAVAALLLALGVTALTAWAQAGGRDPRPPRQDDAGGLPPPPPPGDQADDAPPPPPPPPPPPRDPAHEYIGTLAELNLRPDFTLTAEQKTKLAEVLAEHRKAAEAYHQEHAQEIQKLRQEMRAAREAQDPDKARQAAEKLRELMRNGPKPADLISKVQALLTAEQRAAVDARFKERQEQRDGGGPDGPPPPPDGRGERRGPRDRDQR